MLGFKLGLLIIGLAGCLAVPLNNDASRVVGGAIAPEGSHPHIAALTHGIGFLREVFCGGSILSSRSVLTAAHCIDSLYSQWGTMSRLAGIVVGTNRLMPIRDGDWYEVVANATHPDWDRRVNNNNDIGFVFTSKNIVFTPRVQAISLNWDFVGADVPVRAAGFGDTSYGGWLSDYLLELNLRTIDGEQCIKQMADAAVTHSIRLPAVDPEVQICADYNPSNGRGMCHGDSGSPLTREVNGMQTLVGLVSWGVPCGRDAPDVYVRVSAYRTWILRNMV